ncbi:hypothetical protein ACFW1J_26260 [Priestia aryabhattai]|uniref:hypothetical protein n=1 Tax=Priestia aryabhattai TaxID=412384 RepID=UPI001C8D3EAE|nr:hypothetical protein [Priestia aryabhattai]MBX9971029.1 hypothetical protein [Priestia aryabhattai]
MYNQRQVENQRHSFVVGVEYRYEDLFVKVELGEFCTTPRHAQRIANSVNSIILLKNHMVIIFKNAKSITISDNFLKHEYQFKICIKPTVRPLKLSAFTRDQSYIVNKENMKEVNWNLQTAFQYLQDRYDAQDRTHFSFCQSSFYAIPLSVQKYKEIQHETS